jgi:SAM-dependent methyltransferase
MKLTEKLRRRARYLVNDSYNQIWSLKLGIPANEPMPVSDMKTESASKEHAQPYMMAWFKNLDRLLAPMKGQLHNYSFVDAGCGRGLVALYAARNYPFLSVSGFDFEPALIEDALKNKAISPDFRDVNLFVADASHHKLEERKQIVFMFNPFNAPVMEDFLENNIDTLRKHESVIAYANHNQLDVIRRFSPASVLDIPAYKCSLISFARNMVAARITTAFVSVAPVVENIISYVA